MTGLIIGSIIAVVFIVGTIVTIGLAISRSRSANRGSFIIASIIGITISYFVVQLPYVEYNLLYNYTWVDGEVIATCKGTKGTAGYEFAYFVNGQRYTNCNSKGGNDDIEIGDHFQVRVSEAAPDVGRIDFDQPR
jgi:hypothetical protein